MLKHYISVFCLAGLTGLLHANNPVTDPAPAATGGPLNAMPLPDRRFLIDFGGPTVTTTLTGWNNLSSSFTGTDVNLVTSSGASSTVNIEIVNSSDHGYGGTANQFNAAGYNGTLLDYPVSACNDSHYSYLTGGVYKLKGLRADHFYTIRIFGSRAVSSPDRVGSYTFNRKQKLLNAANNTSQTVIFYHLKPNAQGELVMDFGVAPNSQFGYLNVMDVTETSSPGISAPSGLSVQLFTVNGVLTWTDNSSNEQGFKIERRTGSQNLFEVIATVGANTTQYTDANLTPGSYEYRVFAYNASEESAYSNEVNFFVSEPVQGDRRFLIDFGSPSVTTSLTGWNNLSSSTTGTTLDLVTAQGDASVVDMVIVKNSDDGYGPGNQFNPAGYNGVLDDYPASACSDSHFAYGNGGKYKLTGLNPNKFYTVRIFGSRDVVANDRVGTYTMNYKQQTLNAAGNTSQRVVFHNLKPSVAGELLLDFGVAPGSQFGYMNVMDIREKETPSIHAPLSLQASVNILSVTLMWTDNSSNETGFKIERRVAGTTALFQDVGQVNAGITQFTETVAANAAGYEYRVYAFNSNESSAYSSTANSGTINGNHAPSIQNAETIVVKEGEVLYREIVANDQDNDALTFSLENAPAFVQAEYPQYGIAYLTLSPQAGSEGEYEFFLHCDDVHSARTSTTLHIKVLNPNKIITEQYAFQYKYDSRKRMTHKKVPGADWVYMVYDNRDRVVMTQDGEQRKANKWSFTKYDALNRPVITGIYTHSSEADQSAMAGLISQTSFCEYFNGTSANHGYTNNVFPQNSTETLTVIYYDDYAFMSLLGNEYGYTSGELQDQDSTFFNRTAGQVTGTKTKVLFESGLYSADYWLASVNYYDDKYRLIQQVTSNSVGSVDKITNIYDFSGKVLNTKTVHGGIGFVKWRDLTAGVRVKEQKIFRSYSGSDTNEGAASSDVLPANTDGWFEFTHSSQNMMYIGFSDSNPGTHFNSIDYSIRVGGSGTYAVSEGGGAFTIPGTHQAGDVFRIERVNGVIRVIRNGAVEHTFTSPSTSQLLVDACFYSGESALLFGRASFAGKRGSMVRSVEWKNPINVSFANNQVTATGANWSSGAVSRQVLKAGKDGWMEYTITGTNSIYMLGLSNVNPDAYFSSIKYGFYATGSGGLAVTQNGTYPAGNGNVALGSIARIERIGTTIYYKINGNTLYTSPNPSNTDLFVDCSLANIGHTFQGVILSPSFEEFTDEPSPVQVIDRTFDYDHAGRLLKTWHAVNTAAPVLIAKNEYNELGQLVKKNVHNTDSTTTPDDLRKYKQQVDYRYNIRGWLTRMNNADLNTNDGGPKDYFGMDLRYNENDVSLHNSPAFNGNISGMKWSTNLGLGITIPQQGISEPTERAYTFGYDPMNRLLSAMHRTRKNGSYAPSQAFFEDSLAYDLNGNIRALGRTGSAGSAIDKLVYAYGGNQLLKVKDHSASLEGFVDGADLDTEYLYDDNGNMTADKNKSISAISYNHLNLPLTVNRNDGQYIRYAYDAGGRKLSQSVYNAAHVLQKKTDYAGEFFYENDSLKFISQEEGRVVMTGEVPEYQYHLKDHLGNVRMTFTTKEEIQNAKATLEMANASDEYGEFLRYNTVRRVKSSLFDHTNGSAVGYAERLSGGLNEKYGLAKSLSVMPGDTVNMEVYAKYANPNSANRTVYLNNLITAIAGGTAPAGTVVDGAAYSTSTASFNMGGHVTYGTGSETTPKAYLNYIVFDRKDNVIDFGFKRITEAAMENGDTLAPTPHERLFLENILIREPGYVYIYLSNENETPVEVFFDDFKVVHIKSPVVQMDDYYPFGLTFNSYSRENSTLNKFKFQGQEHIDDLGLGWDSFKWRNHQPDIGRFFNIDPLSEQFYYNSPYAFSENKVVAHIELEGLESVPANKDVIPNALDVPYSIKTETEKIEYEPGNPSEPGNVSSYNEEKRQYDIEGGQTLPSEIVTTDGQGNGVVVKIKFGAGFSSDGNHTPNNRIAPYAVEGYVEGVKNAIKNGTCIETLTVTATTNGHHGEEGAPNWDVSNSNHYTRNGADALDTGVINGKQATKSNPATAGLQNGMKSVSNISEHYGPTYKSKQVGGHDTWIHTTFKEK